MSSNLPTRRVTRTTRTATAKDNENANARPSRIAARAKPASLASATAATGGTTRATAGTAASRGKINAENKGDVIAGKRKREALVEVTSMMTNNKPTAAGKGKDKETVKEKFDGVVINSKAPVSRQQVRTVAGTRQTARVPLAVPKADRKALREEAAKTDEDAMVIDPPIQQIPSITVRKSLASKEKAAAIKPRSDAQRRASLRTGAAQRQAEDAEFSRVFKKRRTSSEAPEDPTAVEEAEQLTEEEIAAARLTAEIEAYAEEAEADPETSPWDDLDADDADDPLMISEYVVDIFNYLKQIEITTMPNPNYMESQKELAWKMRGILTDWLIQVHVRFRLLPETLFLCVNIIDRFLSARVVSLAKLQLVGVTCMFIAAKFEEIVAPSVTHFLMCADASYTDSEILQAERYVLKTLDWNLSYPNPVHYLRRVSKADEYNVKVRTLAKYLLEIGCLEWRLIAAPPSLIAAASIWLARLALGMEVWTPNLAHYSSYPESALVPTANLMVNYILKPIRHESFHKKYAGKRYFKSSIFMRDWALGRWAESSHVDLHKELPKIKAEIRLERHTEERLAQEEDEFARAERAALDEFEV